MEELSPRQIQFLKNYLDPESETFSNALQSGIRAGFSEEYSKNILNLMPDWLSENIEEGQLVAQALKNLRILLEGEDTRVRADLTKFVLERLNKKKFSTRSEIDLSGSVKIDGFNFITNETDNKTDTEAGESLEEATGQQD